MAFWENVNAGLKKAVDEGWTAVRDSARIGRNRYKLHTLHKQAEALFTEIGGIVYDMADSEGENPLSRPEVQALLDDIKRIEAQSANIEIEIEQTREHETDDGVGGAEEGAWPAAVSKEAYAETDDEEDMAEVSAKETGSWYEEEPDELDDDTLGIAGDPQADDSGEGVDAPDDADEAAGAGEDEAEDDTEDDADVGEDNTEDDTEAEDDADAGEDNTEDDTEAEDGADEEAGSGTEAGDEAETEEAGDGSEADDETGDSANPDSKEKPDS